MKKKSMRLCPSLAVTLLFLALMNADAQELPSPESVRLETLGYMSTFPPVGDKIVDKENWVQYPQMRWALQHVRELWPTRAIRRGALPPSRLPEVRRNLDEVKFSDDTGREISILDWQNATYTDALIVMHKGKLIYERYDNQMRPETLHLLFSVTKSFTGLLAAQLAHEGKIDPEAPVTAYIPELARTAWGDMKVRHVMDMTGSVNFREDYLDPTSDIFLYGYANGMMPLPENYKGPKNIYDFLMTLKKGPEEHGSGFVYRTVHSEVLGWIISRVTGRHFADLFSERIWQKLGMEEDACLLVDSVGTPLQGGGLSATARDLARFGEMLRLNGEWNGQNVFDRAVLEDLRKGGDPEKFKASGMTFRPGYSYRNQWWILHNADGAFEASGIHGQMIHINPAAEMVVVKLSSHPLGSAKFTHALTLKAWEALARAVRS